MKKVSIAMVCCAWICLCGCAGGGDSQQVANAPSTDKVSMELVLNIERKIKPEYVQAYKSSFLKCKESTMQEPGCIRYDMYQSLVDSTVFFIAETWTNEEALRKHSESEHLKTHISEIKDASDPSFKGLSRRIYVSPDVNE